MQDKNEVLHAFRLLPAMDLKNSIQQYLNKHNAGWIATCVGSLTTYNIRFANRAEGMSCSGYFEILNLTGTVSSNGSHIHLIIGSNDGRTIGGHLLSGCIIYTTAEIIIAESPGYIFSRESDGTTGWKELEVKQIN